MVAGTIVIAGVLSPYASSKPDGLDRVAEDHQFADQASPVFQWSPFPDYEAGSFASNALKVGTAGVLGIILVISVLYGITYLLAKRGMIHDRQNNDKSK
ncbi:hypothetical protein SY83_07910 [Paenibacillus swuensis]|uniref:PDGLE domain-containing protein n=2 Tax=Paenibacillus swuensis TaxID=1178515 RepID=A0A172TNX2_9BACL|nr:hypothetical protein SY83_07910 [Paenibacillus swuensis]